MIGYHSDHCDLCVHEGRDEDEEPCTSCDRGSNHGPWEPRPEEEAQ